jgi:hypothetical protein
MEAGYHLMAMGLHLPLSLVLIPLLGFQGGLWSLFLSGAAGSVYFFLRFHRFLGERLVAFARSILLPPALAAGLAGAVTYWVGDAMAGGAVEITRARAIAVLLAGGAASLVVTGGVLFVSRYVSVHEVHELMGLLVARLAKKPQPEEKSP